VELVFQLKPSLVADAGHQLGYIQEDLGHKEEELGHQQVELVFQLKPA
jgi:hypothetical protein